MNYVNLLTEALMNLDQINDVPDILMEFLEYHSPCAGILTGLFLRTIPI